MLKTNISHTVKIALFLISAFASYINQIEPVKAQRYNISNFTVSQGLPNEQITCILQDDIGYLWVGTAYGVCRFNGVQFLKFESENPVSQNTIKSIYQDREGNVWIGMLRKGVARFSGVEFSFLNTRHGLLADNVNAVCQDPSGRIWFGTSLGISIYDGKKFESLTINDGLCDNSVTDLKLDSQGNMWVATLNGVSKIQDKNITNYSVREGLNSDVVYEISLINNRKPMVSTSKGVSVFEENRFIPLNRPLSFANERVQSAFINKEGLKCIATYSSGVFFIRDSAELHLTIADGLGSNVILCTHSDKEGNFWFGTTNGLTRFAGDRFISFTTQDGLAGNNLLSVYVDSSNRAWFGTLSNGLSVYDGNLFRNFGQADGLKSKSIWKISSGDRNHHWLATTNGPALFNLNNQTIEHPVNFLNKDLVYQVLQADSDIVYFATDKGLFLRSNYKLQRYGANQMLIEENVRTLYLNSENELWIGTLSGLFILRNGSIVNASRLYNIPQVPVTDMTGDSDGRMIISTFDFGLFIIENDKSTNLSKNHGLYSSRILKLCLDRNNILWMGTNAGVETLNWAEYIRNRKIFNTFYDKGNGYFGNETNGIAEDRDGNIWLAAANGAFLFNRKAGLSRTSVPQLTLTKIQLFLKDVDWSKRGTNINPRSGLPVNLVLPYDQNYLSFYFTGIYLSAPEEVKYQFLLEGLESAWNPSTSMAVANYSNIPPGKFTFKVRASVNERDWTQPITFEFEVKPPIWLTPVAYLFYLLSLIIGVSLILQLRTRSLNRSRLILKQKVDERTKELNLKNAELEKLSLVASETDNVVMIFNQDFELEWVNQAFSRLSGYSSPDSDRKPTIFEISTNENIRQILDESIKNRKAQVYESRIKTKDGDWIWVSSTLNPIFDDKGNLNRIVVIDTDITYRKKMEEQITASLHEKGLLLKEIHHRVKNNLQIIISLFNLQSGFIQDKAAREALKEGQDRIKSIALIHDRFYQAEGTSRIEFDDYIKRLCENIFISSGISRDRVKIEINAQRISLNIDQAVPCGLIINEIVSNSLKHAFGQDRNGSITIDFKNENGRIKLCISDNGKGLPASIDFENPQTLGIQLIRALAEQIDADISVENKNGVTYFIQFKMQ